jgi:hypothetical protein
MPRNRSKHNVTAENDYESWSQEQLEAELARYGYRWEPPPARMTVVGRPVAKVLNAESFQVLVYVGPMLYWHYRIVPYGSRVDHVQAHLVRGGAGTVMFEATRAALRTLDRVVDRAADALRD